MLDANRYRIALHAAQRAIEMEMSPEAIIATITRPENVRTPGPRSKYYNTGRRLHDWGEYTAVVEPGEKLDILTFLWRHEDGWQKSYAAAMSEDRDVRLNPFGPSRATA